jgi:hypothetical protein
MSRIKGKFLMNLDHLHYLKELTDYANKLDEQGFHAESNKISDILIKTAEALNVQSEISEEEPVIPVDISDQENIYFKSILAADVYDTDDSPTIISELFDEYKVANNKREKLRTVFAGAVQMLKDLNEEYETSQFFSLLNTDGQEKAEYETEKQEIQHWLGNTMVDQILNN